jgi:hypothetical protein
MRRPLPSEQYGKERALRMEREQLLQLRIHVAASGPPPKLADASLLRNRLLPSPRRRQHS